MKMRVRDLLVANRVLVTTERREEVRAAWEKHHKPGATELAIERYDTAWGGWRLLTLYEQRLILEPPKP